MPRCPAWSIVLSCLVAARLCAQSTALTVNPASREEVRQFFRSVYNTSENVPMGWTGNYATGNAGDTSPAFKDATRLRINFFRALVGVPAGIQLNPTYNSADQQAALMQGVNAFSNNIISLNHAPPSSWTFYTAAGADASSKSNLYYGKAGASAISGYVADAGPINAAIGHRRWLLFPQTLQMGTGDVPGDGTQERGAANALWILDTTPGGTTSSPRPATRTPQVTYPPAGYVPYQIVWPRWSFSYTGADFSAATVTMTRAGQSIPVRLEPLSNATVTGEPTLVWIYDNADSALENPHPRPTADTSYTVNVNNVRIGGASQNFSYTVTVFDPDVPGPDYVPVAISGSGTPHVDAATSYTVAKPGFATAFEWRTVDLAGFTKTYTAENGLDGLTATTTPGYAVVQSTYVAAGTNAYHLGHLKSERSDQLLQVPGTYFVTDANAAITFRSRLGIASAIEEARVEISTDEGNSWILLYAQKGTSPTNTDQPAPTEAAFVARSLSLAAYAQRTINVRFVFAVEPDGAAFPADSTLPVGWFIDDLSLARVQVANAGGATRISSGTTFSFTPSSTNVIGLQARSVVSGGVSAEWGPATTLQPVSDAPAGYLANLSVRTAAGNGDQKLIVGFAVSGGTKSLLVRGIGPTLTAFGVGGALSDPQLELYAGSTLIESNDNWNAPASATFSAVGAFPLTAGSRDAAIVTSLASASYTAQVSGVGGVTGIALVELYDAAASPGGARLVNVSARSQVGTGDNILFAGFTVAGSAPRTLLVRAIGPTLGVFGVGGVLADPKLELYTGTTLIQSNDNWDVATRSTFGQVGAFDLTTGSRDAVLLVTLNPGSYTAQVSGVSNTTGVALVEVYEVP